jgi:DNA-binding transcriptional LysR family regulator
MDINLLRTFVMVAECGSFSKAAERLHLTQSTISHQISRLEEHLGKKLFVRTTRTCQVTQWGGILASDADKIIKLAEDIEAKFNPVAISGIVRAGIPDDVHLFKPLSDAILLFSKEQPGMAVEIIAGMSQDLVSSAAAGNLDVVLLRDIPVRNDGSNLATQNLVWIAQKGWRRPSTGPIPVAFVHGACSYKTTAIRLLESAGMKWHPIMTCTSLEGVLSVVKAGIAVSLICEADMRDDIVPLTPSDGFPDLPTAGLSLQYAEKNPSTATCILGELLSSTISQLLQKSRP